MENINNVTSNCRVVRSYEKPESKRTNVVIPNYYPHHILSQHLTSKL